MTLEIIKEFSGNSSVYHAVKGMLFINNKLIFQIKYIYDDNGDANLPILNEERLKRILYKKISQLYNLRKATYDLTYAGLPEDKIDRIKIKKYPFRNKSQSDDEDDVVTVGGRYALYPRGFRCHKCADFRIIDESTANRIRNGKCLMPGCDGTYRQIAMVKFCEQCGKLDEIYYETRDKRKKSSSTLKLYWEKQDEPSTWRFITSDRPDVKEDFLKIPCAHFHYNREKLSNAKPKKYKPMSITSGGVIKPSVTTVVDIPDTYIKHPLLEQLICSIVTGKLEEIEKLLKQNNQGNDVKKSVLQYVDEQCKLYQNENNKAAMKQLILAENPNLNDDEVEKRIRQAFKIDIIDNAIEEIKNELNVKEINFEEISNFFALKGLLNKANESSTVMDLIKTKKSYSEKDYQDVKANYKISKISYLSKLNLIANCFGTITGPTFKSDESFVPHFSPIWEKNSEKKNIEVYSYPYETEGILFEFNKESILKWLEIELGKTIDEPFDEFFLKLKEESPEYTKVFTLLHTISHILIKKSSIFTGINTDSCSEMIFPTTCSILIHSTSTINIGGFGSLFENNLLDLFNESDSSVNSCIYDPFCIDTKGACFSCMYLPEFVCSHFNNGLDREIVTNKEKMKRFKNSFW